FLEQVQRAAQRVDAVDVQGAALEAFGSVREVDREIRPIEQTAHRPPAGTAGAQLFDHPVGDVEETGAFRPQQPFVGRGGGDVDEGRLDVESQGSQSLDGVDHEEHAAFAAG